MCIVYQDRLRGITMRSKMEHIGQRSARRSIGESVNPYRMPLGPKVFCSRLNDRYCLKFYAPPCERDASWRTLERCRCRRISFCLVAPDTQLPRDDEERRLVAIVEGSYAVSRATNADAAEADL